MQKLILISGFFLIVFASTAQIVKGTIGIGGEMQAVNRFNHDNADISNSLVFSPSFDFFFLDNMCAGVQFSFENSKQEVALGGKAINATNTIIKNRTWGIHPQYKYYKNKIFGLGEKVYIFGQINCDVAFTKVTYNGISDPANSYKTFGLTIRPGLNYKFSERVAMEFLLGDFFMFAYYKKEGGGHATDLRFLNVNLNNLAVGLKIYF